MKAVRINPRNFFLNVRGLIVIYLLLCILTVLFSRIYFLETLEGGSVPEALPFFVFITIPLALLLFLGLSVVRLVRESVAKKPGARFQMRLLAYFIVIVAFAAVPVTVITTQAIYVMVRYWRSIRLEAALDGADRLAMDLYRIGLDRCELLLDGASPRIDALMARAAASSGSGSGDGSGGRVPPEALAEASGLPDLLAVQDFRLREGGSGDGARGGVWEGVVFAGAAELELQEPPVLQAGFAPREMGRDRDVIRYVMAPAGGDWGRVRVASWHLGEGFDETVAVLAEEKVRFDQINNLGANLKILLVFYYGMFFFPALLMTAIIAISLTRRVAQPIAELTEATGRVAEGDFSIQILVRQGDEFGTLIQSFNAMVRDIQKSRNALVKAEKISLWQSMAQQLAHEIKNPLTPIKLSAERVLRRWRGDPARIGEILESSMMAIVQEVQGLSNMLTEFRTLSRPLEPSRTWTALKAAITGNVAAFITPYPQVQFDMDHVDGDVEVRMESRHLNQVLTNLIINSIDAMNAAGTIEFRTDRIMKRESGYCRLSIRDTGKGIAEGERDKVFTPYFTTKDTGTGLGLPIVERIVTDHGGSIWLNSAEGAGTTFYIDFPLDETEAPEAAPPPKVEAAPGAGDGPAPAPAMNGEGPDDQNTDN